MCVLKQNTAYSSRRRKKNIWPTVGGVVGREKMGSGSERRIFIKAPCPVQGFYLNISGDRENKSKVKKAKF